MAKEALRLAAYAKINLSLEVLGRRDDGFHEVVTITQVISLGDRVSAWPADRLRVTMDPPLVEASENLVLRAAHALAEATGRQSTGHVHVEKRVPLAAGLGGGSSDAAAALRLLDRMRGTRLGSRRLGELAATLGSDVPLFLGGGTSLLTGRGEIVSPLPSTPLLWLALACPDLSPPDKTRALYRALGPSDWTDGSTTRALAATIRSGASVLDAHLVNSFDAPAAAVFPDYPKLRAALSEAAGVPLHLTGAGPTLFCMFAERAEALGAARRMHRLGVETHVARTIATLPRITRLRDYLKTGMRAASPAEQEVQDDKAKEGASAAAADLAGTG